MSEELPTRRQSRAKKPQSYRLDDKYAFLDEDSSATPGTQTPLSREFDDDNDDDFMHDDAVREDDEEDEDVDEEGEEDSEDEDYGGRRRSFTRDTSGIEFDSGRDPHPYLSKRKTKSRADVQSPAASAKGSAAKVQVIDNKPRTRGVADFSKVGGQEIRLKDLFGPDNEALKPILNTRDHWYEQEAFPLRTPHACMRSFFENPAGREQEEKSLRTWYAETGRCAFKEGQETRLLSAADGEKYMATDGPHALNVLWGPAQNPRVRTFNKGDCVSLNEAFENAGHRRGWLFHLDTRIQDAQWASNEEGTTQYLAVAVEQKPMDGNQPKPLEQPKAPAFSASISFPASIQLWAFDMTADDESDTLRAPRLEQVICTDWGAPKQLRWCPIEATDATHDIHEDSAGFIGLLAGIWSDGRVRILHITRSSPGKPTNQPTYIHYTRAAFDISIPNTVPSCLNWLSAASLGVATAAGTVGIWTITRPGSFSRNVRPWFYHQLADTYIITMSSGWPSQPHFVSLSIADGFARLFDLRSPQADTTTSIRGRTLCVSQAWHEQTQTFVMPDEYYILKHTPVRRYYHNLYSMRLESSISRVATSPVHPALLIASVEGVVEASNPVGRITNYKVIPWQQKWFVHEWRRRVEELVVKPAHAQDKDKDEATPDTAEPSEIQPEIETETATPTTHQVQASTPAASPSSVPPQILSQPLARITEGFKATQPGIQQSVTSKKPHNYELNRGLAIYEANSAVTVLAWNPNLRHGTWAVAGMADGLLRVEDVGVA